MNGKIRIRTASRISLLVTGILSALCLATSLLGVQKYTELRNITKEMVNCQNIIENLQSSSNTLTRQVRLAAMTGNNHYVGTYFTELSKVDTYEAALQKLSAYDCEQEYWSIFIKRLFPSMKLPRKIFMLWCLWKQH